MRRKSPSGGFRGLFPEIWPGLEDENSFYWPFDDPAQAEGSEAKQSELFRRVRDETRKKLEERVTTL
jgi:hypothetical protein